MRIFRPGRTPRGIVKCSRPRGGGRPCGGVALYYATTHVLYKLPLPALATVRDYNNVFSGQHMTSNTDSSALVIFSGGQDSATCLGWALNRFDRVFTVGFDYGQRHHVEM